MRLERLIVSGSNSLAVDFPTDLRSSDASLLIVSGPNGSGKSLLTASLYALFAAEEERSACAADLLAAGVEEIRVEFSHADWKAVRCWMLESDQLETQWQAASPAAAEPPRFLPSELFPRLHIIRSGSADFLPDAEVRTAMVHIARLPLECELAGWSAREAALLGSADRPGRLALAQTELKRAEADRDRLEENWANVDALRGRERELHSQLTDIAAQHQILVAEADEVARLCATAERCARLEAWATELRTELRDVQALREEFVQRQARLEDLEDRFRDAPADLPRLIEHRRKLLHDEESIRLEMTRAAGNRELLAAKHRAALEQLQSLDSSAVAAAEQRAAELRRQANAIGEELTRRLRQRIELIRATEGARQQLERDFAAFLSLTADERAALESHLDRPLRTPHPAAGGQDQRAQDLEAELAEVERSLQTAFAGFESLPNNAPQQLRELHDLRNLRHVLTDDLDNLRRRVVLLRRKAHPVRSAVWSAVAGLAGFGVAALWLAWDISILCGLAASGLVMLLFRYIYRDVMADLESGSAAEVLTQQRLHETEDAIARLERQLAPLAGAANLDSARLRFAEFRRLLERRAQLLAEREKAALPPPEYAPLPQQFAGLDETALRQQLTAFRECETKLAALTEQGLLYAEDGAATREIRDLERRAARANADAAEAAGAVDAAAVAAESRRSDLTGQIDSLARELERVGQTDHFEELLAQIRGACERIERDAQGFLRLADIDVLAAEWAERESIRGDLRDIRSRLSSRQTSDELRARDALLTEEFAEVRQKMNLLDPLYLLDGTAADYVDRYRRQMLAAQAAVRENEDAQRSIESTMRDLSIADAESALAAQPPLADLCELVESCRVRVGECERELATTRELLASIRGELADVDAAVMQDFDAALNRHIRDITRDQWSGVEESGGEWFARRPDGAIVKLRVLSDGIRDAMFLAVRLAILAVMTRYDDEPVVWDEPLLRLDDEHRQRLRRVLERCAAQRQVILLTRQSALETWGSCIYLSTEQRRSAGISS